MLSCPRTKMDLPGTDATWTSVVYFFVSTEGSYFYLPFALSCKFIEKGADLNGADLYL